MRTSVPGDPAFSLEMLSAFKKSRFEQTAASLQIFRTEVQAIFRARNE